MLCCILEINLKRRGFGVLDADNNAYMRTFYCAHMLFIKRIRHLKFLLRSEMVCSFGVGAQFDRSATNDALYFKINMV